MDLVTPGQQQKLAALERVADRVTATAPEEPLSASLLPMRRRLTAFGVVLGTVVGLLWLLA